MLKIPDHQVAGHQATNGTLGPLIDDSGHFYKPLQGDERGSSELTFYIQLSTNTKIPDHIRQFFPIFHGTHIITASNDTQHPHIVLQDLTSSHQNPSIMDIKIGSRTWGPEDSSEYITKCLKRDRETTSLSLGFRISGLQIFINKDSGFYKPPRDLILKSSLNEVRLLFRRFVSSNPNDLDLDCGFACDVYGGENGILAKLLELKAWFEDQTIYHFCACSILFVFEKEGVGSNVQVKLIDFAHVTEGRGVIDHNFLGGLCSLIKIISEVLAEVEDQKTRGLMKKMEQNQVSISNGH